MVWHGRAVIPRTWKRPDARVANVSGPDHCAVARRGRNVRGTRGIGRFRRCKCAADSARNNRIGLDFDGSAIGFGVRAQRFALVAEDGVVKVLNVEKPMKFEVSDADTILAAL